MDVSFAIMAEDGYEALSMRRIAQELGTGPASLYAHVASKAELDSILIDVMASEFEPPSLIRSVGRSRSATSGRRCAAR